MMIPKLKLIGNGTHDYIGDTQLIIERPGGIYTIQRHLRIPYAIYPTLTSNVGITIGREREKISNWNQHYRSVGSDFARTQWAHISYIDAIDIDMDRVKETSKFISADLCFKDHSGAPKEYWEKQFRHLDWVIAGTEELADVIEFLPITCMVIERHKESVWLRNPEYVIRHKNFRVDVRNPVGAGDVFVAEFLNQAAEGDGRLLVWPLISPIINSCVQASVAYLKREG